MTQQKHLSTIGGASNQAQRIIGQKLFLKQDIPSLAINIVLKKNIFF
jgi:hypothetical protein